MKSYDNRILHVFNRGARKKIIFKDEEDYLTFLDCLKRLNTNLNYLQRRNKQLLKKHKIKEKALVKIHSYSFIDNHYHLILEEIYKNGIPLFMQKVSVVYTLYFNKKYKTSGVIFQGGYKYRQITSFNDFIGAYSYVAGNSVVHGLVKNVLKYRWSNISKYNINNDDLCTYDLIHSLGYKGKELVKEVNRMSDETYVRRLDERYCEC